MKFIAISINKQKTERKEKNKHIYKQRDQFKSLTFPKPQLIQLKKLPLIAHLYIVNVLWLK